MSGSKQHFIPQFLLREFAHERKRGEFQVRVHRADRTYLSAVENVAAQNHFYSNRAIDPRLDDEITVAENRFAEIHRKLHENAAVCANDAADLVSHLVMRGAHFRKFIEHAGSNAIALLNSSFADVDFARRALGIDRTELKGPLRKSFDEKYNQLKGEGNLRGVSRHDFRKFFHNEIWARFNQYYAETIGERTQTFRIMREAIDAEFVAAAHNRALLKDSTPKPLTEAHSALEWSKFVDESCPFILPDCVSIAQQGDGSFTPTMLAGADEFEHIYFPISAATIIIGSKGRPPAISVKEMNESFASASWEFFISNPKLEIEAALQEVIRSTAQQQLEKLFAEALEGIALGTG